jgi:hypothetical protein
VKTGGNLYVELKSTDKDNLPEDPSGNVVQLVLGNGVGHWRWSLKAKHPGRYELTTVVVVRRGNTSDPLATVDGPLINISAEDTFGTWTARWAKHVGDFLDSVGGALAAQFTALVGFLVYRFNKRNAPSPASKDSGPQQVAPSGATETPPSQPPSVGLLPRP